MAPLETLGRVLIGWCALAVVVAAGWSRFMAPLRRWEQHRSEQPLATPRRSAPRNARRQPVAA
jgi:hypothetical protein